MDLDRRTSLICAALFAAGSVWVGGQGNKTWKDYGGGLDSSHYVALDQITKANVKNLEIAWTYPIGDDRSYLFNPIVVDGVMYVAAANNSLVAVDAATGKEIWVHENLPGMTTRGISFWESRDGKDRRLIFTMNNYLQEIDARTGKSILTFGRKGLVDLRLGLGRDPEEIARIQPNNPGRVFENLILLGSSPGESYLAPPGDIRAFDVVTGKLVWAFHTIPHPGEPGYETWPKDAWKYSGGANTWGEITVDEKRGIAYFPTGSPTYDYYGADRIGSNLYANCLLALDARTGKRLWHFQMVHHDLWDYDTTAAPQLVTVQHDGKPIDVVAQSSKQGFMYVFDRVTGQPLWPIEERPVPKSNMPGEQAWPTQPFPTVIPPFARQHMTAEDVNPYILSPEERSAWKDRVSKMRNEGLFTPPGLEETLSVPGARGGSNWGTGAANPSKGFVYLTTQDWPTIYKLSPSDPLAARGSNTGGRAIYETRCRSCHAIDAANATVGPPPLGGIGSRLPLNAFRQAVLSGRGEMPAFRDVDGQPLVELFAFLNSTGPAQPIPPAQASNTRSLRPIVASGGAPGGLTIPAVRGKYTPLGGPDYPGNTDTPKVRYYTDWGLYPNQPYIFGPPWSAIVAYDLNKGTIKWRAPLGEDAIAAAQGAKNAGAFMAEHHGMAVTSTGLIFIATTDGKVRAHDEETGEVLWSANLPAGSEGMPAMYEVNGRQFLVVPASSRINLAGGHPSAAGSAATGAEHPQNAYVAFALPATSK